MYFFLLFKRTVMDLPVPIYAESCQHKSLLLNMQLLAGAFVRFVLLTPSRDFFPLLRQKILFTWKLFFHRFLALRAEKRDKRTDSHKKEGRKGGCHEIFMTGERREARKKERRKIETKSKSIIQLQISRRRNVLLLLAGEW